MHKRDVKPCPRQAALVSQALEHRDRLFRYPLQLLGADATVDYSLAGWSDRVRELTADGRGVDVVFENISSPELFGEALSTLRAAAGSSPQNTMRRRRPG